MTDEAKKYLSDILRAIELVESFTESISNFDDYSKNFKTQSAVERQLGIVGEAVNKFKQTDPSCKLSNTREIFGFSNRLIHNKLKRMKNLYLILAIIGFISPNILVAIESLETGNILLYTNPMATLEGMFANRISSIFMIDLLFTVLIFFIWTYVDGKKTGVKNIGLVWVLTMLLGLAGGFPLYLYLKEKTLNP